MKTSTKATILNKATYHFANHGYESFSIRSLAETIPLAPSVIYHHFQGKDALLQEMFHQANKTLGQKRAALPKSKTASAMLKQRIVFQIDNQEKIVAVLKYYLAYRHTFSKFKNGFVPDKSALHIEEVLQFGKETKEFYMENLADDAKVITHAINGFLLEYYPYTPKGKEKIELVEKIYSFLIRALKGGETNEKFTSS